MAIKILNKFDWWLNANTTNYIGDSDLIVAKNVFYNSAKQVQTRRGYAKFGNQIGSSPITSVFSYQREDTQANITICVSWNSMYSLNTAGDTRSAISWATNLIEFEPWTTRRTRRDFMVFNNVVYMCDGVNPYCKYDGTTFTQIWLSTIWTWLTFNDTTDKWLYTSHWLNNGDEVYFTTGGTAPTGLTQYQVYYVINKTTNDFEASTSYNWTKVDFTTNGSGTMTLVKVTEPRPRYMQISRDVARIAWMDKSPSTAYYSNPLPGLSNLDNVDTNAYIVGKQEEWIITWLSEYWQWVLVFKSDQIYYASLTSGTLVSQPVDSQSWWYADRVTKSVGNSLVYYSDRWIDSVAKRTWVDGAWALESQPLSEKIKDIINQIQPISYNSSAAHYHRVLQNYYFSFDLSQDDIPEKTLVYSALTGWWSEYIYPTLYDYGTYKTSTGIVSYIFTSWSWWQAYKMEYWFDDDWTPIDAEIQTKKLDFGDISQVKTFDFIDIIWWKQEWWDITATVYVDEDEVWEGIITDSNINISWSPVTISYTPLWEESIWSWESTADLVLYPYTVRIPFFHRWSTISLKLSSSWVQWIFERMRINVNSETIDTFAFNNIL